MSPAQNEKCWCPRKENRPLHQERLLPGLPVVNGNISVRQESSQGTSSQDVSDTGGLCEQGVLLWLKPLVTSRRHVSKSLVPSTHSEQTRQTPLTETCTVVCDSPVAPSHGQLWGRVPHLPLPDGSPSSDP